MTTIGTPKRYTLDGEPVTLAELRADNEEGGIDATTWAAIHMLAPGDSLSLGGGAGADFVLRREE
jgi:hypothetical protein